jgi:predicted Zn-dependent protease with MMP-like domain
MIALDRAAFEALVEEALDDLPAKFKKLIDNVAVIVEDHPSGETRRSVGVPSSSTLLGVYHGVPFQHRGPYYGNLPPDVIVIYQKPIESICATEEEVREQVRDVVIHEVGHYFGFSDRELRAIERQAQARSRRPVRKRET